MTTIYRIVPVTNRSDVYAAGYDGNQFATEEEARAAIENLCATDSAFGEPSEWTVVETAA